MEDVGPKGAGRAQAALSSAANSSGSTLRLVGRCSSPKSTGLEGMF